MCGIQTTFVGLYLASLHIKLYDPIHIGLTSIEKIYIFWFVGISKQLDKISKTKDCQKVKKWMRAIRNHVHWTAASSKTGPERVAKWTSLLNHVQDIHTHDDPLFPKCLHAIRSTSDKNKWLSAGLCHSTGLVIFISCSLPISKMLWYNVWYFCLSATPAFYKLEKALTKKTVLRDIAKLSPYHQAPSFEAYHAVILRFAPKNVVYPYLGMLCR